MVAFLAGLAFAPCASLGGQTLSVRERTASDEPRLGESGSVGKEVDAGSSSAPERPQVAGVAHISEEVRSILTYPFSEPNPVPILARDRRLYPYHTFEGYAADPVPRDWRVVKLENDLIEVFVLPEVGGKVWGAVVKETGQEFIYRNEVLKFRNIALRGPWTSGGIELNFGVIGHAPWTATPVDYALRENADGSVSCWVGSTDLPSRTRWRVEIRLAPDRANFETRVVWSNPTPLEQPYYNWMTGAAFARDDLEMFMPGNAYLQHSGQALDWPVDSLGRYLPMYRNNTFEGHKSYHVVGELHDFFGGYYHDEDFGFGHWSRYEEMPGQKLWLWALSREGGVWEDLLTDTDGQYVEFQAGRLLVQYSPGSAVNPITQARFDPLSTSRWTETWFPVEGIGGLSEASRDGAMHVTEEDGRLTIAVNAFRGGGDTLLVWWDDPPGRPDSTASGESAEASPAGRGGGPALPPQARVPVVFEALVPVRANVRIPPGADFRVRVPGLGLDYSSDPASRRLSRPFHTDLKAWEAIPETDRLVVQARELMKGRWYGRARPLLDEVLAVEPWNRDALLAAAELSCRSGLHEEGLRQVTRVLQLDAYDPEANFLAGVLYRARDRSSPGAPGSHADARDAFGWAARSMAYRSAAYLELAEIAVEEGALDEARRYVGLADGYDEWSPSARWLRALVARSSGRTGEAENTVSEMLERDPLDHGALAERYLAHRGSEAAEVLLSSMGGEYPDQTLLELALDYWRLGRPDDGVVLLRLAEGDGRFPHSPVRRAWLGWLTGDTSLLAHPGSPAFVFPYRPESLPVLAWAAKSDPSWVWRYLLALNLWGVDRDGEALEEMKALGEEPDYGPAYAARGLLALEVTGTDPEADLRRAVELDPDLRVLHVQLIRYLQDRGEWEGSLRALEDARGRFPSDFNLDLLQAGALLHLGRPLEAAEILDSAHVLPSENARDSHRLYEEAHTLAALDALDRGDEAGAMDHLEAALQWPESLGQGRPYEPEERLVRFLQARVMERLGDAEAARNAFRQVVEGTERVHGGGDALLPGPLTPLDLLLIPSLEALGRHASAQELQASRGEDLAALRQGLSGTLEGRMILRALRQQRPGEGRETP